MAKGYSRFNKSNEQQIFSKKEIQKPVHENKNTQTLKPINDSLRERSQQLIKKLRKITFNSISSNQEKQKSSNICNNVSEEKVQSTYDMSKIIQTSSITRQSTSTLESQIDLISTSNGEFKLKGILKNSTKNYSCSDSCNNHNVFQRSESHFESCHTKNSKANFNGLISSDSGYNSQSSALNSSIPVKHVTFSDKISKMKYKPYNEVPSVTKLSRHQQQKLNKLHRTDSLNLHPINRRKINFYDEDSIDSLEFQGLDFYDSTENELSDDDDDG